MRVRFSFHFPKMEDPANQTIHIETYGGTVGTAFNRAFKFVKARSEFKGIPKLCPASVGISILPHNGERGFYSTEKV